MKEKEVAALEDKRERFSQKKREIFRTKPYTLNIEKLEF